MNEIQCIYCLQSKPLSGYSKTEHVIPQSFGKFSNNLTLNKQVCDDCNKYFGDNLEIDLARDTVEGLSRFDHGIKHTDEFKSLGSKSRLTIKVSEGKFQGALVYLEAPRDGGNLMIRPVNQIGFLHAKSGKYSYFTLDKIPHKSELEEQGYDLSAVDAVRALGLSSNEAKEILASKDIILRSWGNAKELGVTENEWGVDIEASFDIILFRAIAKIAFNYFIYWKGIDLAKQTEFNTIRSFIRNGIEPSYPLISILDRPILADEPNVGKRRLGHLVTLNWSGDHKSIVSMVSLFNLNTYLIILSRDYSGHIQNLPTGHFFDAFNREILPLQAM